MRPTPRRLLCSVLGPVLVVGTLVGCSGDSGKAAAEPSESPSTSATTTSPSASPTPTSTPTPERPTRPGFAPGDKGRRAFAEYVVASWGYALSTNDASAVTGLSPSKKEQCRGCKELTAELERRDKEGWRVDFPGARVRKTALESADDRILATTTADIPASKSFFEDGTFRNDNDAHTGAKFLIDLRIDGEGKKQRYVLLAFSLR